MIGIYGLLRFLAELRDLRKMKGREVFSSTLSEKDKQAKEAIQNAKSRMRWHSDLNPEWIPPLMKEVPRLVKEIAQIYHPNCPEPLLAPGLSHFTKAIQLAAQDVTNFLERKAVGRLADVSAHTVLRTWEKGQKVMQHQTVQQVGKWYKRILPYWQIISFKSPLTWASMAVNNLAVRTLQPAVLDIIARRAVDLYSGNFSVEESLKLTAKREPETLVPELDGKVLSSEAADSRTLKNPPAM